MDKSFDLQGDTNPQNISKSGQNVYLAEILCLYLLTKFGDCYCIRV